MLVGNACFSSESSLSESFINFYFLKRNPVMSIMKELTKITSKYNANVIDHFENPRNVGSFDKNSENVGTGIVGAPACGDVMKLQIKVNKDNVIEDAKFKTFGCGSAIASSSFATEWIKGKTIDESLKISNRDIAKKLSLPSIKNHCSMLAEEATTAAINDYMRKKRS